MASLPVSSSIQELEEFLQSGIDPVTFPSVAYGISKGEKTVVLGSAGYADADKETLATTRTPYSLASVTKPMTTTALAILVDRGLVDLDAPVNEYLGEQKLQARVGSAENATVRTVANHTSGLPLHYQFFYQDEPYRPPTMDETIAKYGKLYNPPGEHYQYSNIGYGVLDYVVERVSGRSYAQFMAEEVFRPLGMAQASIGARGDQAISYGADGVGYPPYGFDHPGASAAFASVEDLLKFGQSHLGFGTQILNSSTRREMQRPTASSGGTTGYGVGWASNSDFFGIRTVSHSGGMSGVNTVLTLVPEHDLAIAILVNGQSQLPFRGVENALAALIPAFAERLAAERQKEPVEPIREEVPTELLRHWSGCIETDTGDYPLVLELLGPFEAVALYGGNRIAVEEVEMKEGRLKGTINGIVPTVDAARRMHQMHLNLSLRGDALCGPIAAVSTFEGEGGGEYGNRRGNAVCFWTCLR